VFDHESFDAHNSSDDATLSAGLINHPEIATIGQEGYHQALVLDNHVVYMITQEVVIIIHMVSWLHVLIGCPTIAHQSWSTPNSHPHLSYMLLFTNLWHFCTLG
jgi:hypothetical protein